MSLRQEQMSVEKGPDAFRTISEVAEDLDLPQHVLRFWETRFPQIRPLKRGGGRRYYRPDDVELLRGVRHLLYGEGYTIRGVQRILKEEGPRYVQAIWRDAEAEARAAAELDEREERAGRHATVDAGHPGRAREAEPPRSGPLSGILNLLPTRQREPVEEPSPRRGKRRPENEPDLLELPLLPDMAPQSKPSRQELQPRVEPPRMDPPRAEPPRMPPPRSEPPLRAAPPRPEAEQDRTDMPDPRRLPPREPARLAESRPAEPRPEGRAAFPFRAVAPEPDADDYADDVDYVPERSRPAPVAPRPAEPSPVSRAPLRADGAQENEIPVRAKLSRDDVQRLQAALYELQDCRRILDTARAQG
ncbi:MerR family transcriptional regulator [Starkeya sp. 3C]|uniref:MerR family transcriptional regulator n=1 Tax=Ancylobacter moscoviensis TaxID=2597768 RepID=A0ABY3DPS3_9HYPH|nr:MerR family transcriptional regulator [Ancylobacter moscoviensis]